MNDVILRLLRAARGGGVRISTAEMLDAFEAVEAAGDADRQGLRDTLAPPRAPTSRERGPFEAHLRNDFPPAGRPAPARPRGAKKWAKGR